MSEHLIFHVKKYEAVTERHMHIVVNALYTHKKGYVILNVIFVIVSFRFCTIREKKMASYYNFLSKINRKKTIDDNIMDTPLRRCLSTFDLTFFGIGHMVGAGIFVLTGTVARDIAGPATVISYLLAGIAALLSALCYAEFGARVPKTGSAYTYSYVTIGEVWAFIIGWNIVLEHLLGAASVGRAFSGAVDSLFNNIIKNATIEFVGTMSGGAFGYYPDIVAFLIVLLSVAFVIGGAKLSVNLNTILTLFNIVVVIFIIIAGYALADTDNVVEHGGFTPYGVEGVLAGAATCFYAYIGFEGIAVSGEEAKNPSKSIPIATVICMGVVTLLYMLCSSALSLMVPFTSIDVVAPFPDAFQQRGYGWARVLVAGGSLFGLMTSLIGAMFSLPRAVYAMSADGVFFKVFAFVHPRTQTPVVAILTFGISAAVISLLVDIATLVEFLSIGTLLGFTMVAASILILRYQSAELCQFKLRPEKNEYEEMTEDGDVNDSDKKGILTASQSHDDIGKLRSQFKAIPFLSNMENGKLTTTSVIVMGFSMFMFCMLMIQGWEHVAAADWWAVLLLIILTTLIIGTFLILLLHEQNVSFVTFQVRFILGNSYNNNINYIVLL